MTHVTVRSVTRIEQGVGHELYMDNFSPLQTYMTMCIQEVSTVVGTSDKTVSECQGASTIRL